MSYHGLSRFNEIFVGVTNNYSKVNNFDYTQNIARMYHILCLKITI